MTFGVKQGDEVITAVLLARLCRAKPDGFGCRRLQVIHLEIKVHLLLLCARRFRPYSPLKAAAASGASSINIW
jgi:hypothetical protein